MIEQTIPIKVDEIEQPTIEEESEQM